MVSRPSRAAARILALECVTYSIRNGTTASSPMDPTALRPTAMTRSFVSTCNKSRIGSSAFGSPTFPAISMTFTLRTVFSSSETLAMNSAAS